MTEGEVATNGDSNTNKDTQDLDSKIIRQVEYYFGDYNLPRDKFLQEEIKNDDGWISMETLLKFKRLANLSMDSEVIAGALRKSDSKLIEVHESNSKIRRAPTHPLPIFDDKMKEETMKRTVYCKGFPKDGSLTLDDLLEYFSKYGPYETVLMRYFYSKVDKKQGFKGSVLVVFPDEEKAKEFFDLSEVKFKDTVLIRKWHTDYVEEKKKEIEERIARKEAKRKEKGEAAAEDEKEIEIPKGTYLHMSGIPEGSEVTREEVKQALGDLGEQCAWIDLSVGQTEGYLRFKEGDFNKVVMEKMDSKIKVKDVEIILRAVEGEEEEEQINKTKQAWSRARANSGKRRRTGGRGFQHKRRRM